MALLGLIVGTSSFGIERLLGIAVWPLPLSRDFFSLGLRADRRLVWFWSLSPGDVADNGLAIDPKLTGNSSLGLALLVKGVERLDICPYEKIRHGADPGTKGISWRLTGRSGAPQSGWSSIAHFEHPLTVLECNLAYGTNVEQTMRSFKREFLLEISLAVRYDVIYDQ